MEEILYTIKLNAKDKSLLEYMIANYPVVNQSEQSQSVLDYNIMLGQISDPTVEENKEENANE